ncbi:2-amino-4-hydroxy-6-hydroxymethyldihydropteridine diphosphokinase [Pseudomonas laurylsulfatiphila]|uniref:2-amino-4-hydroxy-6-hydroxymethyldihydropteridine diphosphokinase n=1 Tax=Pseudomonas laurylsulfatiphila TaxID=2011015 RepID=A0A2S6FPT0_9PSED|nr:2-amino-4-hydroxy-6-hydroxymethyldihydropteridine diphosphokinase [Pseudomonas laurylsulfatiphila]PPK39425.1 2-amino-4-hydroxy-6-hydroxymethyldihydropteridine diphosphokinase [Pseudomonas laurylsulfatiphila]
MSTLIYLGLGSNQDRDHHLGLAWDFLAALLVDVQCSPVYSSVAAGCVGDDFFNVVLSGRTDLTLDQLSDVLKRFEARYARGLAPRIVLPVDIDILLYGDFVGVYEHGVLPRSDLIDRPYVMMPLAVLAPDGVHPVTGKTYKATWLEFERDMPAEQKPVLVASDVLTLQAAEADDFVMAQTLKSIRLRQGLTQRKLAEKARVTHSSISVIEKNQASPGVNTLGKILSALSTSLPEFFAEIERGRAEVKTKKRILEF